MAEMDAFERRVVDTLAWYSEDVSLAVDAAAVAHRVALEHPRGRARVRAWVPLAVPRLAWALLLLAALLAALVGGALVAGSQLQRFLPAVLPPVGQVYECPPGSTPDEPGPVDQARPPEAAMGMAFDRRAGKLVVVTSAGEGVETWTFDVCTNTWTRMHPNREPPSADSFQLVYDIDSDATILAIDDPWKGDSWKGRPPPVPTPPAPRTGTTSLIAGVWIYDLQANSWTEKKVSPTPGYVSLAYDPVSGLVVAAGRSDLSLMWDYDVETDTWTPIHQANAGPDYPAVIAFDASVDRIVAYPGGGGPDQTWLFGLRTGTWSTSAAETPAVTGWLAPPVLVYDEAAERTLVGGVAAYDATADRWEILPEGPFSAPRVYDAVNRRLVDWGMRGNDLPEGTVAALDLVTREWTVLLEPGGRTSSTPVPRPEPTSARTATPSGGTERPGLTSPVPTASPTSTPQPTPTP